MKTFKIAGDVNKYLCYHINIDIKGTKMRLCDQDIENWLKLKKLIIYPYPEKELINGITVDIHLGNTFRFFYKNVNTCIDLNDNPDNIDLQLKAVMSDEVKFSINKPFFLQPNTLILSSTLENIVMPNDLVGWLDGRSSLARLGLMIHATAHRIDPGWQGNIVLEIFNAGEMTLILRPKMKIAALSFEQLSRSVLRPYNTRCTAKYKKQIGVVPSRINTE